MGYSTVQKLRGNIKAIGIALTHEKGEALSHGEREALLGYAGFGGIKAILYMPTSKEDWKKDGVADADIKLFDDIKQLHELLQKHLSSYTYKRAIDSIRESVLTAFFTPTVVPETFFRVLAEQDIRPQQLYEPSAGAGVFINEAMLQLPSLQAVNAVEKDLLTARVLETLFEDSAVPTTVQAIGLEETSNEENRKFDLIVSNIPFGNFAVYDPNYRNSSLSSKIHNYFFAKGLDKLADGGVMAFLTTDAFLNHPSNQSAREHLFNRADYISLLVMPDNLMKDTGNTEAASHFLVVQKNERKGSPSNVEHLLIGTQQRSTPLGDYPINSLIAISEHDMILGDEVKPGTNQYGHPSQNVWQHGPIELIAGQMAAQLRIGLTARLDKKAFAQALTTAENKQQKLFTYMPTPAIAAKLSQELQLGLFDAMPTANVSRALDYINELDTVMIKKHTARVIAQISTAENPQHESLLLLTAQSHQKGRYLYKLVSNVGEIECPITWCNADKLDVELKHLSASLRTFGHQYIYQGDGDFKLMFNLDKNAHTVINGLKPYFKEGMLIVHGNKIGHIEQLDANADSAIFIELTNQGRSNIYRDYISLREQYLILEAAEQKEPERAILNALYDRFTDSYGQLNQPQNASLIKKDSAYGAIILGSLERKNEKAFVKADVLSSRFKEEEKIFKTDDPLEALARSLNDTGRVSLDHISGSLDKDINGSIAALKGRIYYDPMLQSWETADSFLSGNVVSKLAGIERALAKDPANAEYQESAEALRKVQPERIPFGLLDFNLGERWIPTSFYSSYAEKLFETQTSVEYFGSLDTFKVSPSVVNVKINQEYAVTPRNGQTMSGTLLLEHSLENTAPFFTYEVGEGDAKRRVPDNDATQLAHQKIEKIRTGFLEWLQALSEPDQKKLEDIYNDTFNCYRLREYDGSHLQFPGLNRANLGIDKLYTSQENAVWRIIQNRGALIDHEVGLGKTLTMILAAQEMKRLGVCRKPMILALKANIADIRTTYKLAYPASKILAPAEDDFTPEKRIRLFHEIKNNHWDCVILTHDQFGKIPQSPEVQQRIISAELDNVERDLQTANNLGHDISKKVMKGLQIRKKNLLSTLKSVEHGIEQRKDKDIDFEQLGIDHLFVDESHKFKNLTFTTRHSRVAGLGNTEGSQKALNMLFAVRTLQERFQSDLNVTFLSGTPISNSLTELYLIFKYLRPREMERQGISNFDGWAAVFAKKTTDFEFSVTNEIIAKERFRHFIKVPELALFYNDITDYKTAAHIRLDRPEMDERLVNIPPTKDQREFIAKLMAFAKSGNGHLIGRGNLSKEEDKARMLIATNAAKKMAIDMRLIDPRYADDPQSKLNNCARNVANIFHQTSEHKGTQLIFCDIGTPGTNGFNVYGAIKNKLVQDLNIPANQVAFVHDWNDKRKPELFKKVNAGHIRILLGSTDKLGTGVNVQQRVVAMHEIDIPWKPSELEQRTGRGIRRGNLIAKNHYGNKVKHFIYATEQSLDNYKFNLLKNKQLFISQMKNNELNVRSIDEGSIDEKSGMNFAEYIAILSGDTTLLEKAKLEKKIAVLENLKKTFFREQMRDKYNLDFNLTSLPKKEGLINRLRSDLKQYKSKLTHGKDGIKDNPIRLHGMASTNPEEIGAAIIRMHEQLRLDKGDMKIGELYGFDLYARKTYHLGDHSTNDFYATRGKEGPHYTYNGGLPNVDNPKLAARYFLNAIDQIEKLLERTVNDKEKLEHEIEVQKKLLQQPFEKEAELADLKKQADRLEREISNNILEKQMKQDGVLDEATPDEKETKVKVVKMDNQKADINVMDTKEKKQRKVRM